MRLAYICLDPGVPVFGSKGSSIHCQEVIREFRVRGWEVELFAARPGKETPLDLQDVHFTRLAKGLAKAPAEREQSLMGLNAIVKEALSNSKPFDLIYERYSLWSFAAMEFARKQGVPGVLEVNAPLIEEQKSYRTLIDESSARSLSEACLGHASSIIAVSQEVAAQVSSNASVQNKVIAIPNGVRCERFSVPTTKQSDSPVIGFVGSLKPWHGVSILLDAYKQAFNANPNIRLKIIGSGPEESNLRTQLAAYSDKVQDSVQWLGAIANADMPEVLSTIDIAVAPYPKLEDFYFSPLKILEYMAAGKAIVASRIGQIPELLPKDTAVLVEPGNVPDLSAALLELCSDVELRNRLGQAAKRKAIAEHSWSEVVGRILSSVASTPSQCETV